MQIQLGHSTGPTPHYSPAQAELMLAAARNRGYQAYNPLRRFYEQMGVITFRAGGRLFALRFCFREHSLTFWFI